MIYDLSIMTHISRSIMSLSTRPYLISISREVTRDYDITLTVETHNFPCGIAPFPGAETGAGGRIRDGESTGKGSLVVAAVAGYATGNLHIPGKVIKV